MTKDINGRLEQLISSLAISKQNKFIYRVGIVEIFAIIKEQLRGGIVMSKPWYMHISNGLVLQNPFYGGSFKRHTHIAGISDIDTYFIYLYG